MNRNLLSIILILSLVGVAVALDIENGVEMRPGEAAAERLFEKGIGHPWVGGNPFSDSSDSDFFVYPINRWSWSYSPFWGHDQFFFNSYQGKTYNPYRFSYYDSPGKTYYPYHFSNFNDGYWWP